MTDDPNGLRAAIDALGDRRRPLAHSLTNYRDRLVHAGDHALAAVWQAVALEVAESMDRERDLLRQLDFDPYITMTRVVMPDDDADQP